MQLMIAVPDENVQLVRAELARYDWHDDTAQVERVLRTIIDSALLAQMARWRVAQARLATVMPTTAYGEVSRGEEAGGG